MSFYKKGTPEPILETIDPSGIFNVFCTSCKSVVGKYIRKSEKVTEVLEGIPCGNPISVEFWYCSNCKGNQIVITRREEECSSKAVN